MNLFDVSGKHVVVTGGSRGIGQMIAKGFIDAGATVYITARHAEDCDKAAAELGDRCISIPADISTPEGIQKFIDGVTARTGSLHVLVNNAGAAWGAPMEDFSEEGFDKVWTLNVKSLFYLTVKLLPLLRKAATAEDPARVINIGSIDGLRVPLLMNYSYSAAKAGVHMLTRHMAHDLVKENITVNAIAPGLFPSKMTKVVFERYADEVVNNIPRGRAGTWEDIAGTSIFLSSRAGAYLTGAVIPVDGGVSTKG